MTNVAFGGKPKTLTYKEFKAEVLRRRSETDSNKGKTTTAKAVQ